VHRNWTGSAYTLSSISRFLPACYGSVCDVNSEPQLETALDQVLDPVCSGPTGAAAGQEDVALDDV
jgi:hypothetical protein